MVSSYEATGTSLTVDSLKPVWIQKWPGQGSPFTMQICEVSKWVMARGPYFMTSNITPSFIHITFCHHTALHLFLTYVWPCTYNTIRLFLTNKKPLFLSGNKTVSFIIILIMHNQVS